MPTNKRPGPALSLISATPMLMAHRQGALRGARALCAAPGRSARRPINQPLLTISLVPVTTVVFVSAAGRIFRVDNPMRRNNAEGVEDSSPG